MRSQWAGYRWPNRKSLCCLGLSTISVSLIYVSADVKMTPACNAASVYWTLDGSGDQIGYARLRHHLPGPQQQGFDDVLVMPYRTASTCEQIMA
ncbi:hypothetical protein Bxe_A3621 [Paraburkholderia xenovorans LB400]|uniref:Lipoprotein n=1 Tax=Paraburkholderia xenovorans (strain LB400) TaxID=266265 RepID=Q143X1_PARXL|nr:hypothetical protein Bxe_A3621 [Paraburkholderia xenovorans LB400]